MVGVVFSITWLLCRTAQTGVLPADSSKNVSQFCVIRAFVGCHVFVLTSNDDGRAFWKRMGWRDRDDIALITHETAAS
jgi:hypothetical protein